jgi:hypothetical protein
MKQFYSFIAFLASTLFSFFIETGFDGQKATLILVRKTVFAGSNEDLFWDGSWYGSVSRDK